MITLKSDGLTKAEFKAVARLHKEGINQGFLSQLGESFLYYLYRSISETDTAFVTVAKINDTTVGFVSGSTGMRPVLKTLVRRHFVGVSCAVLPFCVRPSFLRKIIETLTHSSTEAPSELPASELLSIAVDSNSRGQGVADALYRHLEQTFRQMGQAQFKIVVGDELRPAKRFYAKMGAKPAGTLEVHAGATSTILVADL